MYNIICYRYTIWWFTIFKGHTPFIFITKYWLLSMCCTIYPGNIFFLKNFQCGPFLKSIEFVTILFLFYAFVFWLQGLWDPSSLTSDWTCTPCLGRQGLNPRTARKVPLVACFIDVSLSDLVPSSGHKCWQNHKVIIFMVLVAMISNTSMQISTNCCTLKRCVVLLAFRQPLSRRTRVMTRVARPFKGGAPPPDAVPSSESPAPRRSSTPGCLPCLLPTAVWRGASSPFHILSYPTCTYSVNLQRMPLSSGKRPPFSYTPPISFIHIYMLCVLCSVTAVGSDSLGPKDCSPPGSSVHGILQVGILEWVTMLSPMGSSRPRDRTHVSCIAGKFFTTALLGKPTHTYIYINLYK